MLLDPATLDPVDPVDDAGEVVAEVRAADPAARVGHEFLQAQLEFAPPALEAADRAVRGFRLGEARDDAAVRPLAHRAPQREEPRDGARVRRDRLLRAEQLGCAR